MRGAPQVHELGGRTVFLLPLFHPGGGAAHASGEGDAARGLSRTLPDLLSMGPPVAAEEPRGGAGGRARPQPGRPSPPGEQLDFFWLRRMTQLGRRDRSARRRARRAASARRRGRRQRRGRRRQDDADPRRLPGARGSRDRSRRRPSRSATATRAAACPISHLVSLPARGPRGRGTRRCSMTTSYPTRLPSSSGRPWRSRSSRGPQDSCPVRLAHAGGDNRADRAARRILAANSRVRGMVHVASNESRNFSANGRDAG